MRGKKDFIQKNRDYCIISIILCTLIVVDVVVGLISRLFFYDDSLPGTDGIFAFRLFTVFSNVLVAFCSAQTIPYAIDGLRNGNYHLPRWIVNLLFVGVNCIAVTFVVSLIVIVPVAGIIPAFFDEASFFFHFVSPILSSIMFIFFNNYHHISKKTNIYALAPIYIYTVIYLIMVFAIGEENGGWVDFYYIDAYIPWPLTTVILFVGTAILVNMLRKAHNHVHEKNKKEFENYYLTNEKYCCQNIEEAISILASEYTDNGGDITIPRRIIMILIQRYKAILPAEEYMKIYLENLK